MKKQELIDARRLSVGRLKSDLVDLVLVMISIIAIPALAGSLARIPLLGFLPVMIAHIVIVLVLILITLFRKRLPLIFRSIFMIMMLLLFGLLGLWNFGLSGNGVIFLLTAVFISTILFNRRNGVITLVISAGSILVITSLVLSGHIQFQPDMEVYAYAGSAWLTFISTFIFFCIVLLNEAATRQKKEKV